MIGKTLRHTTASRTINTTFDHHFQLPYEKSYFISIDQTTEWNYCKITKLQSDLSELFLNTLYIIILQEMMLFFIVFSCQSFLRISLLLLMFIVVGSFWYSDCCFCNQCEKINLFLIFHHWRNFYVFSFLPFINHRYKCTFPILSCSTSTKNSWEEMCI